MQLETYVVEPITASQARQATEAALKSKIEDIKESIYAKVTAESNNGKSEITYGVRVQEPEIVEKLRELQSSLEGEGYTVAFSQTSTKVTFVISW